MNWEAPYSTHIPLKHWEHARYKKGYGSLFTSGTECIICLPPEEMDKHYIKISSLLVNVQKCDTAELINADIYSACADRKESMNDSGCIGPGFWFVGMNVEFWQFGAEIIALTPNRLLTKKIRGALWTTDDQRLLLSERKELVLQSPGEKGKRKKEKKKRKKGKMKK